MKALWKTAELSKQNISESLTVQCSSPNYQGYFYFVSSAAPVWRRNQKETETRESLLQSNPVDPSQQENTQRREEQERRFTTEGERTKERRCEGKEEGGFC
ncbi:unnamed protein product [Arctogadus glacialis]